MAFDEGRELKDGVFLTPEFRLSFPNLFEARAMSDDPGSKKKFGLTMLFPLGHELKLLRGAATNILIKKFGEDKSKWPGQIHSPFRDQGDKKYEGYVPGAFFIAASSIQKPAVVGPDMQPVDMDAIYAGCYCRASVRPYFFEYRKEKNGPVMKRGISFGLNNVQKLRDGDPLGNKTLAENDFEPVVTEGGQEAPASTSAAKDFF